MAQLLWQSSVVSYFLLLFHILFIYLDALGLSCGTQDLSLQRVGCFLSLWCVGSGSVAQTLWLCVGLVAVRHGGS